MVISIFVVLMMIASYLRLTGTENIRAIHIVTLIVCGMGFGVFLCNLFAYFRKSE